MTRVVIAQRERTVAIRPMDGGLVAHTLNEQRDLNAATPLFEGVQGVRVDPEMVKLAVQLVDRQSGQYSPADLEDRYETRLRALIDAKLKGECLDVEEPITDVRDNVVDIMAALKKSLGQTPTPTGRVAGAAIVGNLAAAAVPAGKRAKAPTPEELRK